jgi:hypothetical protein
MLSLARRNQLALLVEHEPAPSSIRECGEHLVSLLNDGRCRDEAVKIRSSASRRQSGGVLRDLSSKQATNVLAICC